jgi:hypothetical protein
MPTKVWYEPGRKFYAIEFVDDPIFNLPEWAIGLQQGWTPIWHHLLVACADNKLLYHRVGISLLNGREEFARRDLNDHLLQIARSLHYMGQTSGQHYPEGYTSRQCLRASEILEAEHEALLERLIAANPDIRQ